MPFASHISHVREEDLVPSHIGPMLLGLDRTELPCRPQASTSTDRRRPVGDRGGSFSRPGAASSSLVPTARTSNVWP